MVSVLGLLRFHTRLQARSAAFLVGKQNPDATSQHAKATIEMVGILRDRLDHTLETVLSHAIALEVVNGTYGI